MGDDSVAARREARRLKILQNSQARLARITGRVASEPIELDKNALESEFLNGPLNTGKERTPLDVIQHSEDENNSKQDKRKERCAVNGTYEQAAKDDDETESESAWGDNVVEDEYMKCYDDRESTPAQVCEPLTKHALQTHVLILFKVHLILLAFGVRVLLLFQFGFIFGESIFVPFFVVELAHLLILKVTESIDVETTSLIGAVLMLCGISPAVVRTFTKFLDLISRIGRDFSVYFVSFIIAHCVVESLN